MQEVKIIGAGLAGSEAALQLTKRGVNVKLYEMRPKKTTGAHVSENCAEFVCSNSLGSADGTNAMLPGMLRLLEFSSLLINGFSGTSFE